VVVPYSNDVALEAPLGLTVPFSVAVVALTEVAEVVVTIGPVPATLTTEILLSMLQEPFRTRTKYDVV
jgi:hypothetical protein